MGVFDQDITINRIPESVRDSALAAGVDDGSCLFAVRSDIDLDRRRCDAWMIVGRSKVMTVAAGNGGEGTTRVLTGPFETGRIEKVRTFQTVGSAFMQFAIDGAYVELGTVKKSTLGPFEEE